MRILILAQNTFRESIRDKVLYVLLFFAAATILGSKAMGWISVGQDIKIVKDICLASTVLFGVLIAIFTGASLVYKEIEKRTLYTILAQPMHRAEFILGKYLGLAGILGVATLLMAVVSSLYVLFLGGALDGVWLMALWMIFMELMLITAFSVLLSTVVSPILGAIIVFGVYVAGNASGVLRELPAQLTGTPAEYVLKSLYYIIPNLGNFNLIAEAANSVPVSHAFVAWMTLYSVAYTAVFLILAVLAFEEKDV